MADGSFRRALRRDERGATSIEYGIMVAFMALAVIGSANAIGGSLRNNFEAAATSLETSPEATRPESEGEPEVAGNADGGVAEREDAGGEVADASVGDAGEAV